MTATGGVHEEVHEVTYDVLQEFVRHVPVVILAVSYGSRSPLPGAVVEHFSKMYGTDFACGQLDLSKLPYAGWIDPVLRPVRPDVQSGGSFAGLYLYLAGAPAKHHVGTTLAAQALELWVTIKKYPRPPAIDDIKATSVLECFDPHARAFIAARGSTDQPATRGGDMSVDEARQILDVPSDATPGQIEKAWRRLRGEYAPDKVQHVNAAFVRLASEQVRRIDSARDALRGRRSNA